MASKTDYYELLGVSPDATPDEIKLAYRKQALIWHPDKNADRHEEATERFKGILDAYTVLSDPKERSWYDSHKDQILTGEKSAGVDIWQFFTSAAYPAGFTDEAQGFFKVYDSLFETLSQQENADAKEKGQIWSRPRFGKSDTGIEDVIAFYKYWSDFGSIRNFHWADAYNPNEAPNRRIRRLIDAENKKERQKEKRNYNEAVRGLVDYIKKRDPRWIKYQEQLEAEKLRKQEEMELRRVEEEIKLKEMREKHRLEVAERYQKEYQQMLAEGLIQHVSSEEEDIFACEVCKKRFTNEKQWQNHEKSKKHKQNVQKLLKEVATAEEREMVQVKPTVIKAKENESEEEKQEQSDSESEEEEEKEDKIQSESEEEAEVDLSKFLRRPREDSFDEPVKKAPQPTAPQSKGKKNKKQAKAETKNKPAPIVESESSEEEKAPQKSKRSAKSKKQATIDSDLSEEEKAPQKSKRSAKSKKQATIDSDLSEEEKAPQKSKKPVKQAQRKVQQVSSSESSPAPSSKQTNKKEARKPKPNKKGQELPEGSIGESSEGTKKVGMAKLKREKKKQRQEAGSLRCLVCGSYFDSKNKLFTHLKESGHAQPIS
jgi:DnaJ family protein A protein 5